MTITKTVRVGGMSCVNCQDRIEKKLKGTGGVEEATVSYRAGTATVTWQSPALAWDEIRAAIESLGYQVLDAALPEPRGGVSPLAVTGTLVIILALYVLLRGPGIGAITRSFPLAEAGMNYGMLFVIGLITSLHCAAMCGGINLSQCLPSATPGDAQKRNALFPAILYNAGRVISYTAVGAAVGALGSVVSLPGAFQGIVQLIAGVFMIVMGINMLGIFPWLRRFTPRMPKLFSRKIDEQKNAGKNPLIIGLLNGLMPCGPLQAMQLYALSTGSPLAGGVSMFLFSMGTVPLMFGIGALASLLGGTKGRAFSARAMKAGAILVTVMGMTMFSYGWGLGGLPGPAGIAANLFGGGNNSAGKNPGAPGGTFTAAVENGVQIVNSTLSPGRYPAITVQQGIPVKWTITAPQGSINGCNNRMIVREYKIEHRFVPGENIIEFVPEKSGRFSYSCWMGMIRSTITVVEEGAVADAGDSGLDPVPAGVEIPADLVALATIEGEGAAVYQKVSINLRDGGIEPAIIVVQRNIPAAWVVSNDSLDPGNSRLVFPAYYTQIDMEQGDNTIQLMPTVDFDFSTADNVFYGFVKVVDDISRVDIEAIKTEVSGFETLIYPDAWFEAAAGSGCCGGGT